MAVIKNDRDVLLQASFNRTVVVSVAITASNGRFLQLKNAGGVTPTSITLTATTNVYTVAAIKTWYYAINTAPDTWVSLGTGDTKNITSAAFQALVVGTTATQIFYKCIVTEFGLPDSSTLYFISYSIEAADGAIGLTGATGSKAIVINAFKWVSGLAPTVPIQAFTYTWATGGVSAYPTGWTSSAGAAPGTGYTLYQLNLVFTGLATDITTAADWSNSTLNVLGYRIDGTIGITGDSARVAYIVTTSATPPPTPTAGIGNVLPTSAAGTWSFTATAVLTAGQYLYRVDGTYIAGGNITWGIPYLSNLKVGQLSALVADLGVAYISANGSLSTKDPVTPFTATKTFGSAMAGVFLGYDSTTYKFDIGNGTSFLRWDGITLNIQGTITSTAGNIGGNLISTTGLESPTWSSSGGTTGWKLASDGTITANSGIFRGTVKVGTPVLAGSVMTGSGALLNNDGTFALGNPIGSMTFNGANLKFSGIFVSSSSSSITSAIVFPGGLTSGTVSTVTPTTLIISTISDIMVTVDINIMIFEPNRGSTGSYYILYTIIDTGTDITSTEQRILSGIMGGTGGIYSNTSISFVIKNATAGTHNFTTRAFAAPRDYAGGDPGYTFGTGSQLRINSTVSCFENKI
jgi:hypothetical protein